MKKIFLSLLAVAALASCTKSEVLYEAPQEIGFRAVAGNMTKAAVDGVDFPDALNLYVNSYVVNTSVPTTPDYIYKGEFTRVGTYGAYVTDNNATDEQKAQEVWGGGSSSTNRTPYYWPNEKTLHFSGFSKSGNVAGILENVTYNPQADQLTIPDYEPGVGTTTNDGLNDLMWFPSTVYSKPNGYGKDTKYVPVQLYHTCSWITIKVKGDNVTGVDGSKYKVTKITINGIDNKATLNCSATSSSNMSIVWSDTTAVDASFNVYTAPQNGGVSLSNTSSNAVLAESIEGNTVLIPQKPGTIDIEWSYESSTGAIVTDSATGLSLSIGRENGKMLHWQPGVHYIYTITIKANEILVAPSPVDWTLGNYNVTVE